MRALARTLERLFINALTRADALFNRLYGSRYNPLYQSGTLTVLFLLIVLVTGIYLLIFYRIGAPYESVARITDQVWTGRWMRSLHRYASDAAVLAAAVHAFRMFAQRRSWGPRALAWISGLVLLFLILVCGWTGYVMVWDNQAQVLAQEGARLLDALPLFAEPISRTFVGEQPLQGQFFFLNLFLHIAVPIGLGLLFWLHVSRLARPTVLPPRRLLWGATVLLVALSVVWPITMAAPADLFRLPRDVPLDLFYAFWVPVSRALPRWAAWSLLGIAGLALVAVPLWARPGPAERPEPSVVDERLCTGCEQCFLDCPYDAIVMLAREGDRAELIARVNPNLCVSCGICAGSCAPMGVGPPGRTGRDQLARAREFGRELEPGSLVVIGCEQSVKPARLRREAQGVVVYPVDCVGNLHTSVIEHFVRAAAGVLVASCPPRDCRNREGARWAEARMYHDREAELHARVDRRRVRLAQASAREPDRVLAEIRALRQAITELERKAAAEELELIRMCEAAEGRSGA